MSHRGPDDSGIEAIDQFYFGHRRLSILDLSASGHQPMQSEDGSLVIVFNGEIYNFVELREGLQEKGYRFKSNCDTEVLLNGFHCYGKRFLDKLIGMFAFVIYDKRDKSFFAARDRLGIKPFFYTQSAHGFLFSSEVKSLVALGEISYDFDEVAFARFFSYRYPLTDKSFLTGIQQLPPGHYLEAKGSDIKISCYWDCDEFIAQQSQDLGEEYYLKRLTELFQSAVKYRTIADVPVGAYLSGGVDSSAVVAQMAGLSRESVKTFTIGFSDERFNEFSFAHEVAEQYSTEHQEILVSLADYIDNMREVVRVKDAPLGVPNEVPLFLMSKELKKKVTVVLSGEGADEIFGGYGRLFRSADDYEVLASNEQRNTESFLKKYGKHTFSSRIEHFKFLYKYVPNEITESLFSSDIDFSELNHKADLPFEALFERTSKFSYATQMMYAFEKLHLPGLLQRVDATTMGASVEARVPFVDHRLVEFAFTIPEKYKLKWRDDVNIKDAWGLCGSDISERFDTPKYILKKAFEPKLSSNILYRKKMGFPVPIKQVLGKMGERHLKEKLVNGPLVSSGIFSSTGITNAVDKCFRDSAYNPMVVWMLLSLDTYMESVSR
ncbi:Asparagine synthetase [glutamine-hydrolyzing] 1 [Marinobacterium sp. xm-v-242]|nr:Asparagine synthetase [glutamine-hydrolyzing] 1 [Marinobacterium sp. xm-v-242]NRP77887.1 Asparagine synthetase [glutamine-hydrolyzing] 1 [Marinobacterium sp. xm-m-383]